MSFLFTPSHSDLSIGILQGPAHILSFPQRLLDHLIWSLSPLISYSSYDANYSWSKLYTAVVSFMSTWAPQNSNFCSFNHMSIYLLLIQQILSTVYKVPSKCVNKHNSKSLDFDGWVNKLKLFFCLDFVENNFIYLLGLSCAPHS